MSLSQSPCDEGVVRSASDGSPCAPNVRRWVLVATIAGSSMVFINGSTVNVALPAIQNGLNASVVDMQWVVNAYTLFLAALILLGGSLGDHFGRRRVFVVGVVVFALASVWCALARGTVDLVIARSLQGVGGALLTPGSLAIISATFPQHERGQAIGLWSGFSAMTAALGPVLGGWLVDTLSWRWIFYLHLPLALLVIAVSLWRVPESYDDEASDHLDVPGAMLATLGLMGITYGLLESTRRGFTDPVILTALGLGLVLFAAFLWTEARSDDPMMPLGVFGSSTFSGANLLTLFLYTALGGVLFFLPFNLIQIQGYSATAAGAAFLPFILSVSLLSRWSGGLVERVGAKLPLVVGPLIAAAGHASLAIPSVGGNYWATFFWPILVMGLGMAVSVAPLTTTVMNAVPTHQAGTASGINNAVSRLANLLAVALLGLVMIGVFNVTLRDQLSGLNLAPATLDAVTAERANLAGITPPDNLDADTTAQIEQAIDTAFVRGYRVVVLLCAVLCVLGAGVAWRMIRGEVAAEG